MAGYEVHGSRVWFHTYQSGGLQGQSRANTVLISGYTACGTSRGDAKASSSGTHGLGVSTANLCIAPEAARRPSPQ